MDSFIYALVMVPALHDLLPRSGIAADTANTGFYGGLLFAIFLIGWGCAFLWGPIADRFGRVRTLMLTILCYSVCTFLGCIAVNVWELAVFRLLAGVGIGGEWTLGGVFVAEEWPEDRRKAGAAYMHTGYYFGTFLAAVVNYVVGSRYGWRAVFAVGGAPALLVAFIRYGVTEPARWRTRMGQLGARWTAKQSFLALFSPEYRRRTIVNSILVFVSMVGLWAGSVYVPASVMAIAERTAMPAAEAARYASYATMLLSAGTIFGCLLLIPTAEMMGRRVALGFYFMQMLFGITIGFGCALLRRDGPGFPDRSVLPRRRRRQLRRVHALAAGTISDRMPRQRFRIHNLGGPFPGRGSHVSSRRRRGALRKHRNADSLHILCVRGRPHAASLRPRNARQTPAGLRCTTWLQPCLFQCTRAFVRRRPDVQAQMQPEFEREGEQLLEEARARLPGRTVSAMIQQAFQPVFRLSSETSPIIIPCIDLDAAMGKVRA